MGLNTDTVIATKTVDAGLQGGTNSAATFDLGAVVGNSVIVTGTTSITSLGTASQAGVIRSMIFTDSLVLTNSANLICFGGNDITTEEDDIATFIALTTTMWKMISYEKPAGKRDGRVNAAGLADDCVTYPKLNDACVIHSKMKQRTEVSLADSANTLTADQLIEYGIFKITPTTHRTQTTDSAANIVAGLISAQIGTAFEFTIVNLAAFNVTLGAGANVTLVGNMICNNSSATYTGRVDAISPTPAITIYRK